MLRASAATKRRIFVTAKIMEKGAGVTGIVNVVNLKKSYGDFIVVDNNLLWR